MQESLEAWKDRILSQASPEDRAMAAVVDEVATPVGEALGAFVLTTIRKRVPEAGRWAACCAAAKVLLAAMQIYEEGTDLEARGLEIVMRERDQLAEEAAASARAENSAKEGGA